MGILQFTKTFGDSYLEAACERARALGSPTYTTVKNILKNGVLEIDSAAPRLTPTHENIRGSEYYR